MRVAGGRLRGNPFPLTHSIGDFVSMGVGWIRHCLIR
jgi:hypothetical protein